MMPKVISYTPTWLSRPSPGFDVFSSGPNAPPSPSQIKRESVHQSNGSSKDPYVGPRRTIARRGTEIFVSVGNQLRWSDLCMLKDDWEEDQNERESKRKEAGKEHEGVESDDVAEHSYRVSTSCYYTWNS